MTNDLYIQLSMVITYTNSVTYVYMIFFERLNDVSLSVWRNIGYIYLYQ